MAANCRLPGSHSIYSFHTSEPRPPLPSASGARVVPTNYTIYDIFTRKWPCGCRPCMTLDYDNCLNLPRVGKFELQTIQRGGNPAAREEADRQQAQDELESLEDFAARLKRGDHVAIAARLLAPSGEVDDDSDTNNWTVVVLDRVPFVRPAPPAPAPVSAYGLMVGRTALGFDGVGCPGPLEVVVSGHPYRRTTRVPVPGTPDQRLATVYERLRGIVYFSPGLIRHAQFSMEPMSAAYMEARARGIATAAPRAGASRPKASLAGAFDTGDQLYQLDNDDAAVIATALGRRTL